MIKLARVNAEKALESLIQLRKSTHKGTIRAGPSIRPSRGRRHLTLVPKAGTGLARRPTWPAPVYRVVGVVYIGRDFEQTQQPGIATTRWSSTRNHGYALRRRPLLHRAYAERPDESPADWTTQLAEERSQGSPCEGSPTNQQDGEQLREAVRCCKAWHNEERPRGTKALGAQSGDPSIVQDP